MPTATGLASPHRMSGRDFRTFQEARPDSERWELIDGLPVMMTPPFVDHNRIASNLERLLNDALDMHDPGRLAVQRVGIELGLDAAVLARLGLHAGYKPEPDVAVIPYDPRPQRRFVDRGFLFAEIVSGTDDDPVLANGEPWIAAKARLYRAHAACEAVLIVEQARIEIRVALRGPDGWSERTLTGAGDRFALPAFGLSCTLRNLYAGTHLHPRRASRPAD